MLGPYFYDPPPLKVMLARRLDVGDKLFIAGDWYRVTGHADDGSHFIELVPGSKPEPPPPNANRHERRKHAAQSRRRGA